MIVGIHKISFTRIYEQNRTGNKKKQPHPSKCGPQDQKAVNP
jgi:hypothetical protein